MAIKSIATLSFYTQKPMIKKVKNEFKKNNLAENLQIDWKHHISIRYLS